MLLTRKLVDLDHTALSVEDAKATWLAHRLERGYTAYAPLLTPPSANLKFEKTGKTGTVVYGLALAPHIISGFNVCPASTPECRSGCVAFAGNGRYDTVTAARVSKTEFLANNPNAFIALLIAEIDKVRARFESVAVRLNTFSDIPWEQIYPDVLRPGVAYFDYTKVWTRNSTPQYKLAFSASERTTDEQIVNKIGEGENVAVVFAIGRTKPLPATYLGAPVVDGDKTDARHLDPSGVIVGLRAKGKMREPEYKMPRRIPLTTT